MEFPDDLDSAKRHEEEMSRCDTIINITSAELERIHKEKMEDLKWIAEEYLRTQIDFHERVSKFRLGIERKICRFLISASSCVTSTPTSSITSNTS